MLVELPDLLAVNPTALGRYLQQIQVTNPGWRFSLEEYEQRIEVHTPSGIHSLATFGTDATVTAPNGSRRNRQQCSVKGLTGNIRCSHDEYFAAWSSKFGLIIPKSEKTFTQMALDFHDELKHQRIQVMRAVREAFTPLIDAFHAKAITLEVRAILTERLNVNGIDDNWAQLLYYSPAVIANSRDYYKRAAHANPSRAGIEVSFMAFARVLQEAQLLLIKRPGNGVFTVMISNFADEAKVNPEGMLTKEYHFAPKGRDVEVNLTDRKPLDSSIFPQTSFAELPGQDFITVGIGGGSDGTQASQFA